MKPKCDSLNSSETLAHNPNFVDSQSHATDDYAELCKKLVFS
jgi:hypothetical protein